MVSGGRAHGWPGAISRAKPNWLVTQTPLIGSQGWLANQPSTCLRNPDWVRIFQIALHRRLVLVTGRTPPSGSGSIKPWTPCLSARFPVAIEFQSMGDSIGCSESSLPITPAETNRSRFGISPASRSGWLIFQSAASQRRKRTFFASRSDMANDLRSINRIRTDRHEPETYAFQARGVRHPCRIRSLPEMAVFAG